MSFPNYQAIAQKFNGPARPAIAGNVGQPAKWAGAEAWEQRQQNAATEFWKSEQGPAGSPMATGHRALGDFMQNWQGPKHTPEFFNARTQALMPSYLQQKAESGIPQAQRPWMQQFNQQQQVQQQQQPNYYNPQGQPQQNIFGAMGLKPIGMQ